MDITSINNLTNLDTYGSSLQPLKEENRNTIFETLFQSALSMVNETNALTNAAEEEEIKYAMGATDNIIDLMTAQKKAEMSLQYTVAVRNKVLDAYKEIMNLQF